MVHDFLKLLLTLPQPLLCKGFFLAGIFFFQCPQNFWRNLVHLVFKHIIGCTFLDEVYSIFFTDCARYKNKWSFGSDLLLEATCREPVKRRKGVIRQNDLS